MEGLAAIESYEEWLKRKDSVTVMTTRPLPAGDSLLIRTRQRQAFDGPVAPKFVLALLKHGSRNSTKMDLGLGQFTAPGVVGELILAPPDHHNRFTGQSPLELLTLAWDSADLRGRIEAATGKRVDDFGRLHAAAFRCAQIEMLLAKLWQIVPMAQSGPGRLRFDAYLNLLAARLLEISDADSAIGDERRALSAGVVRMLRDYIEEHLSEAVGVDELAALAGTPALQFSRRFKASFGHSPHRYVTLQRLERACRMLRDKRHPLVDIAMACGFCDQSHMNRIFKAHLGVTPVRYRLETRI